MHLLGLTYDLFTHGYTHTFYGISVEWSVLQVYTDICIVIFIAEGWTEGRILIPDFDTFNWDNISVCIHPLLFANTEL